ncbi:acetyltransferase [Carnobacterium maltaromaticum]|uniref:acetyltransferase n=1 Tax=Carnobacterium maltaromaticum TaxID=2751 RepID=UPI0039AF2E86
MKKIAIIGASGFGKEIAFLIERLSEWEIIGFYDDNVEQHNDTVYGYKILGSITELSMVTTDLSVVCAIGKPKVRKKIIDKIQNNKNLSFPNIIDSTAIVGKSVELGMGNIICANAVLTVDIKIDDFNIINLSSTIGHDVTLNSFNTLYPTVNVSGNVTSENYVEFGTGTQVIQGLRIAEGAIIGAGSVVVRDIERYTTSVGVPAKTIKFKGDGK